MKHYIRINQLQKNPSLCDGPGYRKVLFLQGCRLHCEGCQNVETWNENKGELVEVSELAQKIRLETRNKKLTISGGEPLLQEESLLYLLEELQDFDLCLYTGKENEEDVPESIKKYLKYLKVGSFKQELKTTTIPFIGSTNQRFIYLKKIS